MWSAVRCVAFITTRFELFETPERCPTALEAAQVPWPRKESSCGATVAAPTYSKCGGAAAANSWKRCLGTCAVLIACVLQPII